MDFRELNYIIAIDRYQNISKAAESLYITQPTLSKFLIALEGELGQKLFQRAGNRYIPTYAGTVYLETARQILDLRTDLNHQLADIRETETGILNVAFPSMRCAYMLPVILPEYHKAYPNIKLNVFEGSSSDNRNRLVEGEVDLVFCGMPITENPSLEYEPLWKEELLIITRKDHPAAAMAEILPGYEFPVLDPEHLKNELLLQLMPYQRTRQITEALFKDWQLEWPNTMAISSLQAIIDLVVTGYGISIVFDTPQLHHKYADTLCCFSLKNPVRENFVAAVRKNSYLPSCSRNFIVMLKALHAEEKV